MVHSKPYRSQEGLYVQNCTRWRAPHGGGIEPGTSELAEAIASKELSFYVFEGVKRVENGQLHITSTRFDEPVWARLLARAERVIAIHREDSDETVVFLGGLDLAGVERLYTSTSMQPKTEQLATCQVVPPTAVATSRTAPPRASAAPTPWVMEFAMMSPSLCSLTIGRSATNVIHQDGSESGPAVRDAPPRAVADLDDGPNRCRFALRPSKCKQSQSRVTSHIPRLPRSGFQLRIAGVRWTFGHTALLAT